jgi:AraC family transcriptional regulator
MSSQPDNFIGDKMNKAIEKRILRVQQYIHENPAADLSLDALADIAAMSRFHWHRVYHGVTGETCAQSTRRIRMFRAAGWLLHTDWPLQKVMQSAGYSNAQSFARSFKATYGQSPAEFRQKSALIPASSPLSKGVHTVYKIEIKETPRLRLASLEHLGSYMEIGSKFSQVATHIGGAGLFPKAGHMVGIYYDDPSSRPESELRSSAGIVLHQDVPIPAGLAETIIPEGQAIVLRYQGPYAGLRSAYEYLYGTWIAQNNPDLADFPAYEVYLNSPTQVAPDALLTDICVPLKPSV